MDYKVVRELPDLPAQTIITKIGGKWCNKETGDQIKYDPAKHSKFFRPNETTLRVEVICVHVSGTDNVRFGINTNPVFNKPQAEILKAKLPEIKAFIEGLF